jgi:hypothetical protein
VNDGAWPDDPRVEQRQLPLVPIVRRNRRRIRAGLRRAEGPQAVTANAPGPFFLACLQAVESAGRRERDGRTAGRAGRRLELTY